MLRISKNLNKIVSIKRYLSEVNESIDIDSFLIIPGVTIYTGIYQSKNTLCFMEQTGDSVLVVEFPSEGDVDRFFTFIMRDIKLNQIMNLNDSKE